MKNRFMLIPEALRIGRFMPGGNQLSRMPPNYLARIARSDYRMGKLIYESFPGFQVTAD